LRAKKTCSLEELIRMLNKKGRVYIMGELAGNHCTWVQANKTSLKIDLQNLADKGERREYTYSKTPFGLYINV
jgi:hypothetical protein